MIYIVYKEHIISQKNFGFDVNTIDEYDKFNEAYEYIFDEVYEYIDKFELEKGKIKHG